VTEKKMGFDFEALRRGLEGRYAELRIVNKRTPPSSPRELHGKEEISEYLRDVRGRQMTHRVGDEVVGENRVAFNEACEYPDGTRVLTALTLDVQDGKVVRQVNVEAWDE
jgi:hypothetical protein